MNLFLATFSTFTNQYMSGKQDISEVEIRLIRAKDSSEAEEKLKANIEISDPYGTSISIVDFAISACIE